MPDFTIITPTRNRPDSFALLERWVARQTFKGAVQWIVVNDGSPYSYVEGQEVVVRTPAPGEGHSLCENILAAIPLVKAPLVAIMEDDDWYAPHYLEELAGALETRDLAGYAPALYYNTRFKKWRCIPSSKHCSLGMTAMKASVLPALAGIARQGKPFIDLALWAAPNIAQAFLPNSHAAGAEKVSHVGIKGGPGEPGIGVGHKDHGTPDPTYHQLRAWIGDQDAAAYTNLLR